MICEKCKKKISILYQDPNVIKDCETIKHAIEIYKYINIQISLLYASILSNKSNINFKNICECNPLKELNLYYHHLINTYLLDKYIEFKVEPIEYEDKFLIDNCIENIIEKNKYHKIFYGIPYSLKNYVSKEHYKMRENMYFHDSIKGHPMASNGWFHESMKDLEEMGGFKEY